MLWSSQTLQFSLCFALCLTCAAEVIRVSGYEGREVNISCLYEEGFESYEKYLCKNNCNEDADVLIKSKEVKRGRYSTHDDKEKHIFMMTISDLTSMDAGKYWCGLTRTGYDTYPAEIQLEVKKEWCCVKTKNMRGIEGRPATLSCPHPPQHQNNRKFLCKGFHRNNCTDVVTSGSRFTLQEDVSSSSFSVTIMMLEEGDAGMYWCGSDSQWSVGNYTKIELSVDKHLRGTTVDKPKSNLERFRDKHATQLKMLIYIIPGLLLTLSFALIIIYKCKAKGTKGSKAYTERRNTLPALDRTCENPEDTSHSKRMRHNDKTAEIYENVYQNFTSTEDVFVSCH